MLVVYVAGPFRGDSYWDQENNVRRAEELSLEVWRSGCAALCPHANTRFFQGAAPDHVWLEGDLELLRRCDAIIMVSGWGNSIGASIEHDEAVSIGLPIFYNIDELHSYLNVAR